MREAYPLVPPPNPFAQFCDSDAEIEAQLSPVFDTQCLRSGTKVRQRFFTPFRACIISRSQQYTLNRRNDETIELPKREISYLVALPDVCKPEDGRPCFNIGLVYGIFSDQSDQDERLSDIQLSLSKNNTVTHGL